MPLGMGCDSQGVEDDVMGILNRQMVEAKLLLEAAVELRDPARSRAIEQAWGNPSVKGETNIVSMKLMADYGTDNVCEVKVNAD